MIQFEILAISIAILLIQVAGYSLLGQGLLYMLAGAKREQNVFYRILKTITSPAIRAVRFITPRFVLDAHIPFATFILLVWLGLALVKLRRYLCVSNGLEC